MVKKFNAPEPESPNDKTPIEELPKISRESRFSPFGDQKAQRRESLGKSLFTKREEMPKDINDAQLAEALEWLGKSKVGQAAMYSLLRKFASTNLENPDPRQIVQFHNDIKEIISGEDADAVILALIANMAYLINHRK